MRISVLIYRLINAQSKPPTGNFVGIIILYHKRPLKRDFSK